MSDLDPKFIAWMDEFDAIARAAGFEQSYTRDITDPESWLEQFEAGEDPADAFSEEMQAAADGCDGSGE